MEDLLQWVFLSGTDTVVTQLEDGEISADRPETEEKFRALFQETGLRSFFGVLLKDEEGNSAPRVSKARNLWSSTRAPGTCSSILVNQATVAVRNAQLYQQVPLAGFWKPLLEKRRRLAADPRKRRRAWAVGHLVAAARARSSCPGPCGSPGPARVCRDGAPP